MCSSGEVCRTEMNFNSVHTNKQGAAAKKRYHSRSCHQISLLEMNFQRRVKKKSVGYLVAFPWACPNMRPCRLASLASASTYTPDKLTSRFALHSIIYGDIRDRTGQARPGQASPHDRIQQQFPSQCPYPSILGCSVCNCRISR
jgi:hypothetical protein